jgi:GDPmannose 4,6-dehydratase
MVYLVKVKNMETKKALITGITGQDGPYLAEILLAKGYKVYGMVRNIANPNLYSLRHLNLEDKVSLVYGDLSDGTSLENALLEVKPDEIYHLAAQSSVISSWYNPIITVKVNADSVLVFLEFVKNNPKTRMFVAQTSELFGRNITNHEQRLFEPSTPYGVAKLFAYHTCKVYREKYDLFIVNGILYNHESPLRNINFFSRKVSQTVAKIHLGMEKELILGNVDMYRDFGFAKDYMQAAYLTLQQNKPLDYIIATGKLTLLRDFLRLTFLEAGIENYEHYVLFNQNYFRKDDPKEIKGFPEETFKLLNWAPKTTIEELVKLMVAHDIKFIKDPISLNSQYIIPNFH